MDKVLEQRFCPNLVKRIIFYVLLELFNDFQKKAIKAAREALSSRYTPGMAALPHII